MENLDKAQKGCCSAEYQWHRKWRIHGVWVYWGFIIEQRPIRKLKARPPLSLSLSLSRTLSLSLFVEIKSAIIAAKSLKFTTKCGEQSVAGNNNCSNITKSHWFEARKSQRKTHNNNGIISPQNTNTATPTTTPTTTQTTTRSRHEKLFQRNKNIKQNPLELNLKLGNKPILWAELKARQKSCARTYGTYSIV